MKTELTYMQLIHACAPLADVKILLDGLTETKFLGVQQVEFIQDKVDRSFSELQSHIQQDFDGLHSSKNGRAGRAQRQPFIPRSPAHAAPRLRLQAR